MYSTIVLHGRVNNVYALPAFVLLLSTPYVFLLLGELAARWQPLLQTLGGVMGKNTQSSFFSSHTKLCIIYSLSVLQWGLIIGDMIVSWDDVYIPGRWPGPIARWALLALAVCFIAQLCISVYVFLEGYPDVLNAGSKESQKAGS
jgi:hypothetical protein